MAAKEAKVGQKRKGSGKGKPDAKVKKARLSDSKPAKMAAKHASRDVEDISDSESDEGGGAKLEQKPADQALNKKTDGKKIDGKINDGKKSAGKKTAGAPDSSVFDRGGLTSRETHAKQKQLAQERKAAKPLADELQRTKKIWERLRKKSVPKIERQTLVKELFGIINDRCRDFALKHDAVRAVQTAIKYSTPEQRKQIARELSGSYAQLAESRYAKFLIGKLLAHHEDEIRDLIVPEFYGKVRKLINHAESSWILDDIYRTVATAQQKATLLREWYGPEFSLTEMTRDTTPTADLKQILENEPSKRGPIMKSLVGMINSLVQKRMSGFTMLHDAMLQCFVNIQPGTEEYTEFMEMVKGDESGDLLKNMAFTKSGVRLACLLLAHGTSKDRKNLLKPYKDIIVLMSGDSYAHVVILTAYDVIDDTKLVAKAVFPELLGDKAEETVQNVIGAVNNPNARVTLLYLFEGLSSSLFPASHAFDVETLKEVHEICKKTSKKDDDLRRKELLAVLAPQLLSVIATAPTELTSTTFGCQLVTDVLLSETVDKKSALKAIAKSAAGNPQEEPAEDSLSPLPHISKTPFGGRMLKSLIQGGRFDKAAGKVIPVEPPLGFSNVLYPIIKDYVMDWATGPSSFVVLALLEAGDFEKMDSLKKVLRKNREQLEKAATEMTAEQQASREADEAKTAEKGEKKGKKKKAEAAVGNMGSKLLLEKL